MKSKLLTVSLLASASLAACTGGGPPRPGAEDGNRKVLRVARRAEYKSLDPAAQFDSASAEIITNVYDTLLEYDYIKRPYRLVPNLLAKMPESLDSGTTYLFTLRRGVRFADDPAFADGIGRELDIDDVIYSIKRFADANVNAKSYILWQGVVVGLDEFREASKRFGPGMEYGSVDVSGLERVDRYSMKIRFTGRNPLALFPLAASPMSIVAREAVEYYGSDFGSHPVGTGPFVLKHSDRRGTMIFSRNEDYHGIYPTQTEDEATETALFTDAGRALPLVDELHLPLIEESQPAMLRFRRGELDLHGVDRDNFLKMVERDAEGQFKLKHPYSEYFKMYSEEALICEYLVFNTKDPLVGRNKALRQAIAYALDVKEVIKIMLNGRGQPLKTIVPHPIAGSERDLDVDYFTYNPEKARAKLTEAGYPDGKGLPEIHFDLRSTTKETRQTFEFIRFQLASVGIRVRARFHTFSAYLKRVESGNFQVAISGWHADYPDAENFYQLLYGKNAPPGPNIGSFANDRYDRLYEEIRFMPNGPVRFAKLRQMAEIVREEVPVILRYNRLAFGIYQKRVRNVTAHMMNDALYKFLNLDLTANVAAKTVPGGRK